jgi:hypothetical protein
MFKGVNIKRVLQYAVIAAVLFSIPLFFYVRTATYRSSWLLYVGSFLFFIVIVLFTLRDNQAKGGNASTVSMVYASHIATIVGVILCCIMCFVFLSVLIPGYLSEGPAKVVSPDTPINEIHDKTNGLSFRSFAGALILNFSFGSFASILFPFTIKRNQTKDSREPFPLQNNTTG